MPIHQDRLLFELLILEGAQAGLSWSTILKKRPAYRKAFDRFDPKKVGRYSAARVRRLMNDAGIVRNRAKIEATIANARAFLAVQREYGTFDRYIWQFVGGRSLQNAWRRLGESPAETEASRAMSRDLIKRGFRFVGPTICYAFMQAVGIPAAGMAPQRIRILETRAVGDRVADRAPQVRAEAVGAIIVGIVAGLAAVEDVPAGEGRVVEIEGKDLALFNVDGTFYAIDNACAHRGGPLGEGDLEGRFVSCPWHAWRWDVTTGANANNPAVRMACFPVAVENGAVFVEL